MPWLVAVVRVVASLVVADTRRARRRGLLGRDKIEGALLVERARSVHTFGMRFPIDVAFVSEAGEVVKTMQMHQRRVGVPVWRASVVIEAEAGAFSRWGLRVGDVVEIREP